MCIFVTPITSVSKTRILVGEVADGRQLTVYSNQVELYNGGHAAMVLPVPSIPLAENGSITLHSMTGCKGDLFEELTACLRSSFSFGSSMFGGARAKGIQLDVVECGSYLCSVVPTLDHLDLLKFETFGLTRDVKHLVEKHYQEDFGFIVCILKKGAEYHPIAYTHPKHRVTGRMFIPTPHHHPREATTGGNAVDWDH